MVGLTVGVAVGGIVGVSLGIGEFVENDSFVNKTFSPDSCFEVEKEIINDTTKTTEAKIGKKESTFPRNNLIMYKVYVI